MASPAELAAIIEQALLRPDATPADVEALCEQALRWRFGGVCVNPIYVRRAAARLAGSPVRVVCAVGFPLGACTTLSKVVQAVEAVSAGAAEVDVVGFIGGLKAGEHRAFVEDLQAVVRAVGPSVPVKVILETGYLTDDEKVTGARLAEQAGARFVKTCTGFGPGGATVHDVRLLRRTLSQAVGVKAAGGIRTAAAALALVEAGASRLGTSAGVAILQELAGKGP